jgi:RNA polymerase sigma factor (sigma-70 family)
LSKPQSDPAQWFNKEVKPHEGTLRSYLRNVFPSLRDVDDLVQESYRRLLHAHRLGRITHTKAFLFTTARNAALDFVRRRKVVSIDGVADLENLSVYVESPDAAETLNKKQELALLAEAVQSLPLRCREVMTLRLRHGLSQKEIAAKLGVSEHTVKNQLAKGMRRSADFLEAKGVSLARRRTDSTEP